ncbi:hypothetical protein [Lewinella sp. W8]|uniref:hypothetical protein n=1 Tax=Lewinella sp. W8 TaxID=2528208 RepID=UPI001067377C|nr:hypothetical protein [Lewinella sp. W8]MTB51781.1 hypothetical protein [Lewinella sp. W8]
MASPRSPFDRSPLGGIGGFIIGLVVLYVLFKLASWFFSLLWWAAPIIFIASLIIDHKVFLGYVGSIKRLFERNWLMGLAAGVLSIVLFPIVAAYLLGMGLFKKKLRERAEQADVRRNGEWAEFEDVSEDSMDLEIPYEELPPPPEPETRKGRDTNYDELFE